MVTVARRCTTRPKWLRSSDVLHQTHLTAAEHDAKNVRLHNFLQVVITAVGEGAVLVGVGARIVDPEGKGGRCGSVAVQASRELGGSCCARDQGLSWRPATNSLTACTLKQMCISPMCRLEHGPTVQATWTLR